MGKRAVGLGLVVVVRAAVEVGMGVKEGWRIVDVVEEVFVRCAIGRRFA